jgi:hypothetical protein
VRAPNAALPTCFLLLTLGSTAPAWEPEPAAAQRASGSLASDTLPRHPHGSRTDPPPPSTRRFEEVRRFRAPEAFQGVAVDALHFYAINNFHIAKYEKSTGNRVAEWQGEPGGPIVHLNSCIVLGAELVCAHSNFPGVPMLSSIETWNAATLRHTASRSFGIYEGSLTWAVPRDGEWWLNFAHYGTRSGTPGKGPEWTTLVRLDSAWNRKAAYAFPVRLIESFAPYSSSGGNWGADGLLYVSGHDEPELYVLRLPSKGSVLEWVETIPAPISGQAWVFDPTDPDVLWGIQRAAGEVVMARLRR